MQSLPPESLETGTARQQRFQNLLIQLSSSLINLPFEQLRGATSQALEEMAIFTGADRAYIFEYDFRNDITNNTFEYCAHDIEPQIDNLQGVPISNMPEWVEAHRRGEAMMIPRVAELPEGRLKEILSSQSIRSLLALPLMDVAECIGFVGFDSVRHERAYGAEDIRLLRLFGSLIVNIRKRLLTEARLQLASNVFEHSREAIMVTDDSGIIVEVNRAFESITGYSRAEAIGRNPRLLSSGNHDRAFYEEMWKSLDQHGHWTGEIWNRRKSGEVFPELLTISAVKDIDGRSRQFVALFSDITVQKNHQNELEYLAHHDALTGLPNRMLLARQMHMSMQHARRGEGLLAVAYIDLDGFKQVNDGFGHVVGDKVLQLLAKRMTAVLDNGDMLARIGGDEFVVILTGLHDSEAALPQVGQLLESITMPMSVDEHTLRVSGSIGVTFYPQQDDIEADQLLRQADQAMYLSKLSGKNRFTVFDDGQDRQLKQQFASLVRFRQALQNDELVLYYQPKVNLRSGEIVGAEALVRWLDPARGIVPPGEFLPLIENTPMAITLGEWVIDAALRQLSTWKASGWSVPVSVNVGALQLQQADFIEKLQASLARYPDIQAGDLELEVLETTGIEDYAQVIRLMEACRDIGVRFALDDFGSGYSSLTYLKQLPAHQIKIDQSFVRDMLQAPADIAILEGVVGLASALGRSVIAEGMETIEHGQILLLLGCELAQGYGISRPLPADKLRAWASGWTPHPAWEGIQALGRDRLPCLFAMVEFRAWLHDTARFVEGKLATRPVWKLQREHCCNALDRIAAGPLPLQRPVERMRELNMQTLDLIGQLPAEQDCRDDRVLAMFEELSRHYDAWLVPARDILGLRPIDMDLMSDA